MYGEGEDEEGQVGSYAIYFAEGESLAKQGEYKKAIESFTKVKFLYIILIICTYNFRHLNSKLMISHVW